MFSAKQLIFLNFPSGGSGKNAPANAGDTEDLGDLASISGSGRSPGRGMATYSSILAWRIPWTEEPGGLQSTELQRVRLKRLSMRTIDISKFGPDF